MAETDRTARLAKLRHQSLRLENRDMLWLLDEVGRLDVAWMALVEHRGEVIDELRAVEAERDALRLALEPFAKIEVPYEASDSTWVATTKYCNDQITAYSVRRARAAISLVRKGRSVPSASIENDASLPKSPDDSVSKLTRAAAEYRVAKAAWDMLPPFSSDDFDRCELGTMRQRLHAAEQAVLTAALEGK